MVPLSSPFIAGTVRYGTAGPELYGLVALGQIVFRRIDEHERFPAFLPKPIVSSRVKV